MSEEQRSREQLDQAVSQRLARLRTMPVDTSGLDRALRFKLPEAPAARTRGALWLRPFRAVAAVLALAGTIAVLLVATSGGPVLASPTLMAQMHRDLVAQRIPVTKVESIEEASKVLAGNGPQDPNLPQAPDAHVMACCMREVKDKKVACVLLHSEGVPVTLSVAKAADMKLPQSPTVVRDGVTYHVQTVGDLTMVMTEQGERWVCLIGELPVERLIQVASKLQF